MSNITLNGHLMFQGADCQKIEETDTPGAYIITLRFGDEITVYNAINDGILSLRRKTPSTSSQKLYIIRKNWTTTGVLDKHTNINSALYKCKMMKNNKHYIREINRKRYLKGLCSWDENIEFFISIEWDECHPQYLEKKKRKIDQKKLRKILIATSKRKRGRPKGSKNKPKGPKGPVGITPKRKRGRPKGSKNKPK